jgi:4-hydroxybenzoate polyprenyltransferase
VIYVPDAVLLLIALALVIVGVALINGPAAFIAAGVGLAVIVIWNARGGKTR